MAKRRTRKQKKSVDHQNAYTLSSVETFKPNPPQSNMAKKSKIKTKEAGSIYAYDPKLIVYDLIKTVSISALIFAIIVGLYFYGI